MPYSDPEQQKAYRRDWYKNRLANDKEFREAEAERKAAWFAGSEKAHEKVRQYQRKTAGKPHEVAVRFSAEEMEQLREVARMRGMQVRTLIRALLFSPDPPDDHRP